MRAILQNHGGDSYAYRFEKAGKSVVYSTDCEHKFEILDENYPFVEFYRNADLLIFDAMYSLADQISVKEDWGHSNNMVAVELAQLARVKHLVLYPSRTDLRRPHDRADFGRRRAATMKSADPGKS